MKISFSLPAVTLLLCSFTPQNPQLGRDPGKSPTKMWTDNKVVFQHETIDLYFALPHASNLGVIDPDGKFFYIVFPKSGAYGNLQPYIASEEFVKVRHLKFHTGSFRADPYTYGVDENRPVFTKTGTYRFVLGENLHLDDESALQVLKIEYFHYKRA